MTIPGLIQLFKDIKDPSLLSLFCPPPLAFGPLSSSTAPRARLYSSSRLGERTVPLHALKDLDKCTEKTPLTLTLSGPIIQM